MSYAWLTTLDSATSNKVALLIDSTQDTLDSIIGDLSYSQKSEDIRICDIYNNTVQLTNLNVESIDEINGQSYTGVLGVDYQIQPPKNSRVLFKTFAQYLSWLQFNYFTIKYTSGYQTIPDDIKYLQYLLVNGELNKEWNKEVKSYSLWPRSVTFADTDSFNMASKTISKYSIPYV